MIDERMISRIHNKKKCLRKQTSHLYNQGLLPSPNQVQYLLCPQPL